MEKKNNPSDIHFEKTHSSENNYICVNLKTCKNPYDFTTVVYYNPEPIYFIKDVWIDADIEDLLVGYQLCKGSINSITHYIDPKNTNTKWSLGVISNEEIIKQYIVPINGAHAYNTVNVDIGNYIGVNIFDIDQVEIVYDNDVYSLMYKWDKLKDKFGELINIEEIQKQIQKLKHDLNNKKLFKNSTIHKTDDSDETIVEPCTPGEALRGVRYHKNMNQSDLAEKSGLSKQHISEMENNKSPIGKLEAQILAKALGVDYRTFLS